MIIPTVNARINGNDRQSDIFSSMLEQRAIYLTGEINDEVAAIIVAQLLFLEAQDPDKEICMYINSPGGSVTAGLAIYDTMRHVRCNVHTLCIGQACSMAALLLAAGDERHVLPSSRIMIHQPSGGAEGKSTDIVISAKEITRLRKILVSRIAFHTGRMSDIVNHDIERDYFMSPVEAVEYGLADGILPPAPNKKSNKENRNV